TVVEHRQQTRRDLAAAETGQLDELLTYVRQHPGISYEQAQEDTGIRLGAVGATVDICGVLHPGRRQDYERAATGSEVMEAMVGAAEMDGFSPEQIAKFRELLADGHEHARAYALAAGYDPETGQERRPRGRPDPYASKPAKPRHLEVAGMAAG